MRILFFSPCLAALALLVSCDKNKPEQDEVAPARQVAVRYYGENLTGLGARVVAWSSTPTGTDTESSTPAGPDSVRVVNIPVSGSSVAATTDATRIRTDKVFRLRITLENVRGNASPPVGSFLVASIVVNGEVKKSIRLDHTSTANPSHPMAWHYILPREW